MREVAQRQRHRIGGIDGTQGLVDPEQSLHHALDLVLSGATPSGDRLFDLVRTVLRDLATGVDGFGHDDPTRLTDCHRSADVRLEEDTLDGDDGRLDLRQKRSDFALQLAEPLGQRGRGGGRDHASGDGTDPATRLLFEYAVPASRQTRVDAHYEHPYDASG